MMARRAQQLNNLNRSVVVGNGTALTLRHFGTRSLPSPKTFKDVGGEK